MKLPVIATLVIVVAGSLWGVRESSELTKLRERHRLVVEEAAALGLSADGSTDRVSTKASKRPREDSERKVREFASQLVAFAKEMEQYKDGSKEPDESFQKRMMEIMEVMYSLSGAELKLLIGEIRGRSDMDDEMKKGIVSFSIMMLSQKHPEAALALFTESSDLMGDDGMGKHALRASLMQWAKDSPLAALEWIKNNAEKHPDLVNDEAKRAVITGAAQNDIRLAFQLMGELKMSKEQGGDDAINEMAQAATTPEKQLEFLKALREEAAKTGDKDDRDKMLSAGLSGLFNRVAESGYEASMKWLESADLSVGETTELAARLSYHRTKGDTGKWLDWMAGQTFDSKEAESRGGNLMRDWTRADYKSAGEWLAQAPAGPVKEATTMSYLQTIAPYEPEVAAQWAGTLPAAKQQDALRTIYHQIKQKDKAAADEFAAQHGVDVKK